VFDICLNIHDLGVGFLLFEKNKKQQKKRREKGWKYQDPVGSIEPES